MTKSPEKLAREDAPILAAFKESEAIDPSGDLIAVTSEKCGVTEDRVMDALEREAEAKFAAPVAPALAIPVLPPGVRPELLADVALQFERMEQPLSLDWMQRRGVGLAEVIELSRAIAAILRGAGGAQSMACRTNMPDNPGETVLGRRVATTDHTTTK